MSNPHFRKVQHSISAMVNKVLLVEDEATLATIISETLADEGLDVCVAHDGIEGLERFRSRGADIVIADVMMPRMDGFEMAKRIRSIDNDVPLIFLTARSAIDDIVEGFEIGANDYLRKPFKMRELSVRVASLLKRRRKDTLVYEKPLEIGAYTFDTLANKLTIADTTVELTHIEAKILAYFATHIGQTVESSTLMELVWKHDDYYNRNSLHGFIHKLRRHLRHDPAITIINLRGIGYRLAVSCSESGPNS